MHGCSIQAAWGILACAFHVLRIGLSQKQSIQYRRGERQNMGTSFLPVNVNPVS